MEEHLPAAQRVEQDGAGPGRERGRGRPAQELLLVEKIQKSQTNQNLEGALFRTLHFLHFVFVHIFLFVSHHPLLLLLSSSTLTQICLLCLFCASVCVLFKSQWINFCLFR